MRADSSLERGGSIALTVEKAGAAARTLQVRVPEWASELSIFDAGKKVLAIPHDGYASVTRVWKAGETLTLRYAFRTRAISDSKHPDMVSVFYGPWLLGVDEASSPGYFDEPFTENIVKLVPGDVKLDAAAPSSSSAPISVPLAHFKVTYFPGGYPMQSAQAVLRPIAEATSSPDQNQWAFWLPVASKRELK